MARKRKDEYKTEDGLGIKLIKRVGSHLFQQSLSPLCRAFCGVPVVFRRLFNHEVHLMIERSLLTFVTGRITTGDNS